MWHLRQYLYIFLLLEGERRVLWLQSNVKYESNRVEVVTRDLRTTVVKISKKKRKWRPVIISKDQQCSLKAYMLTLRINFSPYMFIYLFVNFMLHLCMFGNYKAHICLYICLSTLCCIYACLVTIKSKVLSKILWWPQILYIF